MFDKAAQAMQEIYGHFYREFEDGTLVTWSLKGLDNDKGPELVVLNHYFTPTLDAGSDKHTPFGLGVDSNGVLACMLDGGGRSSTFVHTEDNQVHYHNSHVKLQGEREWVQEGFTFATSLQCPLIEQIQRVWAAMISYRGYCRNPSFIHGSLIEERTNQSRLL